ncbi:MAG: DUF4491 family protein [Oscillospiraceae bacterium]|jgi:hypothetical protein|nr:DUF4491 family protein [Oscillospiraceae bacterium]
MHLTGILVGLASFAIIGLFHPVVVKTEYYAGKKAWPVFLVVGLLACGASLLTGNGTASALLAVFGFTSFWTIKELFEQEERVRKGWFPANPKRGQSDRETAKPG